MTTSEPGDSRGGEDRRRSDRRAGEDRREQDLGPPDGVERRKGERRSRRDRRADAKKNATDGG